MREGSSPQRLSDLITHRIARSWLTSVVHPFLLFLSSLLISTLEVSSAHAIDLNGDLKLFHVMSGAPRGLASAGGSSSGALTSRLKLKERWGRYSLEGHAFLNALGSSNTHSGPFALSPNVANVGEALPLSYTLIDDGGAQALLRADRLVLTYEVGALRLKVGRQALSFGQGRVFTPLDRVSPFSPAAVDREYKPGVDAARLDGFWGVAGEWTLVAAQRGSWALDHSVFGARIKDSFNGWDLGLIGLWVSGDRVIGLSLAGALGEVSVYGDAAFTWRAASGALARADELRGVDSTFIRSTLGGSWSWAEAGGGSITFETSWLGDGASSPSAYLISATDPRVRQGERWLLGQAYTSVALAQALTPLINASISVIANLSDLSALVGPALSWSVSNEVNVSLGGYAGAGLGLAPSSTSITPEIQSEFGSLQWVSFAMMSAYY